MRYGSKTLKILIIILAIFNLQSSEALKSNKWLEIDTSSLQNGDIILRRGVSLFSRFILTNDPDSLFSHAGIIYKAHNKIFVIHAVADEIPMQKSSQPDVVRKESIESFLQIDRASFAAVYRLKENSLSKGVVISETADKFAQQEIPFDFDFDLHESTKLYCTELVWRAYMSADIDLVKGDFNVLSIPLSKGEYILPSKFTQSEQLYLLTSTSTK